MSAVSAVQPRSVARRVRIRTSGVLFLLVGATLVVAAYRFSLPGLLPAGILLGALVLVSLLTALVTVSRLDVRVHVGARRVDGIPVVHAFDEVVLHTVLTNRSPVPLGPFAVRLEPRPGFDDEKSAPVPGLARGASITVEAAFRPTRRRLSGLEAVRADVDGPFGLVSVSRTIGRSVEVAVGAPIAAVTPSRPGGSAHEDSARPRDTRGTTDRDFRTREYVPGDDLRHVHWKSSARAGELRVRAEFTEENPRAVLVLDTRGATEESPGHPDPATELAVRGAASIAVARMNAGYDVQWIDGDGPVLLTGASGEERLRLRTARLVPGTGPEPEVLARFAAVAEPVVVAVTRQAADEARAAFRRPAEVRVLVAEEAPLTDELADTVFGGPPGLPEDWTHDTRPGGAGRTGRSSR